MVTTTTQSDEQIQKDVLAEWLFGNYCGIRILAKLNYSIINKLYYTVRHFCAVFTVIPKEPAELRWDARVLSNEIGVAVKDGVVTLTGWVDSYTKRWAAENAAYRVRGVKAVVKTSRSGCSAPPSVLTLTSTRSPSGRGSGMPSCPSTSSRSRFPRAGSRSKARSSGSTRSRTPSGPSAD